MRRKLLAAVGAAFTFALVSQPVFAQRIDLDRVVGQSRMQALSDTDRRAGMDLLAAFEREDWDSFRAMTARVEDEALRGFLLAEFYLHPRSPTTQLPEIEAWLARYAKLPQAEQMVRLGLKRGLVAPPALPRANPLSRHAPISKRLRPSPTADGSMPSDVQRAILERISNDDPDGARLLLDGIDASLSSQARAEWRQRVAWSYYIENNDPAALAMARTVAAGSGPWVAEGEWVRGLSAWRLEDCREALTGFSRSSELARNSELKSAASYWAHRAALRCRAPGEANQYLKVAAASDETLYGMLAREQLGQQLPQTYRVTELSAERKRNLARHGNTRLAIQLAELGRDDWAAETLEHEVLHGDPDQFAQLAGLARALNLPRTQVWMGHNIPRGAIADPALRFPTALYAPYEGWRVDPALAFAHALQESDFRPRVVSPANAIGLMQVKPIAARDVDDRVSMNAAYADLKDPAVNLAFGQRNLEKLSESRATQGYLPKVMAAYNAGLTPVTRWNEEIRDQGDPLLYMESIPYWETRGYVATVMRNYWIYLRQRDEDAPSRIALAENDWPMFPTRGQAMAGGQR